MPCGDFDPDFNKNCSRPSVSDVKPLPDVLLSNGIYAVKSEDIEAWRVQYARIVELEKLLRTVYIVDPDGVESEQVMETIENAVAYRKGCAKRLAEHDFDAKFPEELACDNSSDRIEKLKSIVETLISMI